MLQVPIVPAVRVVSLIPAKSSRYLHTACMQRNSWIGVQISNVALEIGVVR